MPRLDPPEILRRRLPHWSCASVILLALVCGDGVVVAQPVPEVARAKNIILLEADGSGENAILATDMYTGQVGHTLLDGPEWVKSWVSTYPLRTGTRPIAGPEGLQQDPDVVYAPEKNYDTRPLPPSPGRYADRFAGYRWTKRTAPDSANTMVAVMTGQKSYNNAVNVDGNGKPLLTFAERAHNGGKSLGVVTTVQISDASPAVVGGAHNVSRTNHGPIAHEMFSAGVLKVIIGTGNPDYDNNGVKRATPDYDWIAQDDWRALKTGSNGFKLIEDKKDFEALAVGAPAPEKLAGIVRSFDSTQFNRSGASPETETPYSVARRTDVPSLSTMALAALNTLDKNPNGLFLLIEGGAVDRAEHANNIGRMIEERIEFDETVAAIVAYLNAGTNGNDWSNTLVLVTADHDHLLLGPDSDRIPYQPLIDHGKRHVPGYRWQNNSHSNLLVPLFARGRGADMVRACAKRLDNYVDGEGRRFGRGSYLDQTEIFAILIADGRCP